MKSDLNIDESKHRESPSVLTRLKHSAMSVVMGAVFAQVMMFAFRLDLIFFLFDNILFISYLIICAVIGWIAGEKFVQTLTKKSIDWWDIWGFWRLK